MRAILWQGAGPSGEIVREILRGALFGLAGIAMDVVDTQEALLVAAERRQRVGDIAILVIDCFYGEPTDIDRCAAIVQHTTLPVHIVHPREDAVRDLEEIAGRPLVWLPSAATIEVLLDKLHLLRALSTADAAQATKRPSLTPREHEIADLIASGESNHDIEVALHLSPNTVKTHIRTLMHKFEVTTRPKLIARCRTGHAEG